MAYDAIPVRLEVKSAEIRETLGRIVSSTGGFHLRDPNDSSPFEILILELGKDVESEFQIIQSFINLGTVREIFLTAPQQDPKVLVRALRAGVREFFPQPVNEQEVRQALENFKQRRDSGKEILKADRTGQIINVVASKGGVGNTTIAVNLAVNLADINKKQSVALVDMNLLFGEVPFFLDIKPSFHWGEVARNITRLDAMFLMSVLHRHSSGVYVLPSPPELSGTSQLTPDIIEKLLALMKSIFDYTVLDSGRTTDNIALSALELSDTVLITCILSVPCLTNVNRLTRVLHDLGFAPGENVRLIVNRYLTDTSISLKDAEESVRMKVSWTVPNDYKITMSAINQGKSLSEVSMRSPTTRSIRQIAGELSDQENLEKKKGSFLGNLFKRS
ncbi:MAG: AAA family ATPase [Syntrophobacteraceae bacterium]